MSVTHQSREDTLDTRSRTVARAEEWALSLHAECGVPALSVAVARPGRRTWSAAFGMADIAAGEAARPDHRFRLGSVSKVVTAVLAVRLASGGLIELDVPIAYWLPDLPAAHRRTTLRQLLTHRGGLRHYLPRDYDPAAPGGPVTAREYRHRDDILALFIADPLVAEPGTRVSYSSYGYSLAAIVLEAAAGRDFCGLVAEWIARPFALASLGPDRQDSAVPGRVAGYFTRAERAMLAATFPAMAHTRDDSDDSDDSEITPATPHNPAFCWAGAGLLADMPDLANFGAALLEGPAARITPDERALLFTPLTEANETSPPLGLGWRVDEDAKKRLRWHHAGTTVGGRASLVLYPGLDLSIALASNTLATPGDVLTPSSELADLFG